MPSRRSGSKRCSITQILSQRTPINMTQKHAWWASRQHGIKGISMKNMHEDYKSIPSPHNKGSEHITWWVMIASTSHRRFYITSSEESWQPIINKILHQQQSRICVAQCIKNRYMNTSYTSQPRTIWGSGCHTTEAITTIDHIKITARTWMWTSALAHRKVI